MRTALKLGVTIMICGVFAKWLFFGAAEKADLPALVQGGALVIDVRTAGEFSGGAVQGAIHIPYDEIAGKIGAVEPDQNRVIIVYCQAGSRARAARKSLEQLGYTNVVNGGRFSKVRKLIGQ
jgi:phage shock protein E